MEKAKENALEKNCKDLFLVSITSENHYGTYSIGKVDDIASNANGGNSDWSKAQHLILNYKDQVDIEKSFASLQKDKGYYKYAMMRECSYIYVPDNNECKNFYRYDVYKNGNDQLEIKKHNDNAECLEKLLPHESGKMDYKAAYAKALASKPFVILAGCSGTGKTRLAKDFAEKIAGKERLKIISVGADWTDNTKVMGYFNPITGKYHQSPILEFLKKAQDDEKNPYFLILDEMNLSHVERYFSDFLSKMELVDYLNDQEKQYFDIEEQYDLEGSGQACEGCGNGEVERVGKRWFPKNLFITGTVNIDETTYMFSSKVLDRANVIEMSPVKDVILSIINQKTDEKKDDDHRFDDFFENVLKVRKDQKRLNSSDVACSENPALDEEVLKEIKMCLGSIFEIFVSKAPDFLFGYRTVKDVCNYVIAEGVFSLDKSNFKGSVPCLLDEQILMKILPKIHGNEQQIGPLLKELSVFCSKYPLSKSKIDRMIQKLRVFKYASFI